MHPLSRHLRLHPALGFASTWTAPCLRLGPAHLRLLNAAWWQCCQIVPNMHLGVDTSSVPGLRIPTSKTCGAATGLPRRLPEELAEKYNVNLYQYRVRLVKQVECICRPPPLPISSQHHVQPEENGALSVPVKSLGMLF